MHELGRGVQAFMCQCFGAFKSYIAWLAAIITPTSPTCPTPPQFTVTICRLLGHRWCLACGGYAY